MDYIPAIALRKSGKSPIDIKEEMTRAKKYSPLMMRGHWLKNKEAILMNNGETAIFQLSGDRIQPTISGGPLLNDEFTFANAHFHWGETNSMGSEHQINGAWFSMEAHIVHFNKKYTNFKQCLKHKDGLCVLAYFFLVTQDAAFKCNPYMEKITDRLQFIQNPGSNIQIPSNCLYWMREAIYCSKYYTYFGSYKALGDPECVIWIIFPLIIPITSHQVNQFRRLKNGNDKLILDNRSNLHVPDGRPIYSIINTFDN